MAERAAARPVLAVYSRRGCHLCEVLLDELLMLVRGRAEVEIRDVDTCEEWRRAWGSRVPVLVHDGRVICEFRLDGAAVRALLTQLGA